MPLVEIDALTRKNIQHALSITPKNELKERVPLDLLRSPVFYKPVGCPECDNTWYKGRVGIYEILEISPGVKDMILRGDSAFNINRQAIKDGMISLEQDGIMKALLWETSLEEVYKASKTQSEE